MTVIDRFIDAARAKPRSIVLPEGTDQRVLKAAAHLVAERIASVIVLGNQGEIETTAAQASVGLAGVGLIDPSSDAAGARLATGLAARNTKIDAGGAASLIAQPLLFGGMMVADGMADAMIAGAANETGKVISAGLKTVGLTPGISRLSSYFLMAVPPLHERRPARIHFCRLRRQH